jgi:NAD(P)-dependent dehydrogenase (short-subunit alcohol dehydrogenase family)
VAPTVPLTGAVAVITGATRGIGRAAATALGRAGASVVVVGRSGHTSSDPRLSGTVESAVAELTALGIDALGVQGDLSDADQTQAIVDQTLAWRGRCDVLVNNAAFTSNGPIMMVPWRRWQKAFRVQVVAPLQLCHGFVPGMLERGSGRVLNVSSGASQAMTVGLALYSTSKLAMERWSDYMELELAGQGVSFNTLRVDRIVATEGFYHVLNTQGEDVATSGQGMSSVMSSEEAADHILWLVTQPTSWTGNTVGFADIAALGGPPAPQLANG